MVVRELLPGELSWADSFIKDLLTESEKYQDVIKDLSTDAISSTVRQLDYASEEYQTGAAILLNRATSSTSGVLVEVDEETDKDASTVATVTRKANKEAEGATEEEVFIAERKTSAVLIETSSDISDEVARLRAFNETWLGKVRAWIKKENDLMFDRFNINSDIITEGNITILSIALGFLFNQFTGFFFEEED